MVRTLQNQGIIITLISSVGVPADGDTAYVMHVLMSQFFLTGGYYLWYSSRIFVIAFNTNIMELQAALHEDDAFIIPHVISPRTADHDVPLLC